MRVIGEVMRRRNRQSYFIFEFRPEYYDFEMFFESFLCSFERPEGLDVFPDAVNGRVQIVGRDNKLESFHEYLSKLYPQTP